MKKAISKIVCADLVPISARMGVRAVHDWMIKFDCACREGAGGAGGLKGDRDNG